MVSIKDLYKQASEINAIASAKGDLLVRDNSKITRLPVGTNGRLLSADDAQTTGLSWVAVDIGFAVVNDSFSIPNYLNTVTITVSTTRWMNVDQYLHIQDAGEYLITAISSTTSVTIQSISPNNPTSGTVGIAKKITPSGQRGEDGLSAIAYSTSSFTIPSVDSTVIISVDTSTLFNVFQPIYIQDAGYFEVTDRPSATQLEIKNLGWVSNFPIGSNIPTGKLITASGVVGANGISSFAILSSNFTVPAVDANVTITIDSNQGFAVGQGIFIENAGSYQIVSLVNNDQITIKNNGGDNNAIATTEINSGVKIVPGGIQGVSGRGAFSLTTSNFSQPAILATVTVNIDYGQWLVAGVYIYNETGGVYIVETVNSATQIEIKNTGKINNAPEGTIINSGALFVPTSKPGLDGVDPIGFCLSSFTLPALNSSTTVDIDNVDWISVGHVLYFNSGVIVTVSAINNNSITIVNSDPNNTVGTNTPIGAIAVTGAKSGIDGQGIDHISLTGTANNIKTYTVWGNAGETINLGEFSIADGVDGTNGVDGATGSVNSATSLSLDHQVSDPVAVLDKLVLYAKANGLYFKQPDDVVNSILTDKNIGGEIGNIVTLVDLDGNPSLPAVDGSQLLNIIPDVLDMGFWQP